ncbi:hypothetical protein AgCh_024026 [Apium graveolens]
MSVDTATTTELSYSSSDGGSSASKPMRFVNLCSVENPISLPCSDKKSFRKSEGKGGKSDRGDYINVKCYNCGEKGHISPDWKKVRSDKGKALVTKKKSWTDTSDSEGEVNYALMANANSSSDAAELKVPQTTYAFRTDDINELRRYLKTMFIIYRDQTLTSERLTSENLAYKKRNDYLEKELVMFHQTQKDRDDAFCVRDKVLEMNESLQTELEKEREIIKTWTNSGKATQDILSSGNWKEGLGYGDDKNDKRTVEIEPIVVKQKPKGKPTEVNIVLMTRKQLKHKLKDVKNVNKVKPPRKNRNEKEVDEFTRYTWVYFLHIKSETASSLIDYVKQLDKLVKNAVKIIRSDNGTEFKNLIMEEFNKDHGRKQEFSAPGTPQQNGVVKR